MLAITRKRIEKHRGDKHSGKLPQPFEETTICGPVHFDVAVVVRSARPRPWNQCELRGAQAGVQHRLMDIEGVWERTSARARGGRTSPLMRG